jgi:FtsP/CotA-like multicopper oxidase with cupredoxin domain
MRIARPLSTVAVTLLIAGCGAGSPTAAPSVATSPSPMASVTPSAATPIPQPSSSSRSASPSAEVVLAVRLQGGTVTPNGDTVRVKRGQTVLIRFTSDTAESLHLHGYDKELAAKPDRTVQLSFVADQSGVFVIETHETEKLVAKLIVA